MIWVGSVSYDSGVYFIFTFVLATSKLILCLDGHFRFPDEIEFFSSFFSEGELDVRSAKKRPSMLTGAGRICGRRLQPQAAVVSPPFPPDASAPSPKASRG